LNPFIKSAWGLNLNTSGFPQSLNHCTGFEPGLLVNFGHYPKLEYERIAKRSERNREQSLPMSASDLFAAIRVIRGLLNE